MIRLDAAGYAIKKPGTSCFMIPETFSLHRRTDGASACAWESKSWWRFTVTTWNRSRSLGRSTGYTISRFRRWFCIPFTRAMRGALEQWLGISPRNCDHRAGYARRHWCDRCGRGHATANPGLLAPGEIDDLVETIHRAQQGREPTGHGRAANNLDLYQVNCTFYDALGRRDNEYLIARAMQFFAPGIPQVYYVGLLAGVNDMDLLARSRWAATSTATTTLLQKSQPLQKPVVQKLLELIRLRNTHPAFAGHADVDTQSDRHS